MLNGCRHHSLEAGDWLVIAPGRIMTNRHVLEVIDDQHPRYKLAEASPIRKGSRHRRLRSLEVFAVPELGNGLQRRPYGGNAALLELLDPIGCVVILEAAGTPSTRGRLLPIVRPTRFRRMTALAGAYFLDIWPATGLAKSPRALPCPSRTA